MLSLHRPSRPDRRWDAFWRGVSQGSLREPVIWDAAPGAGNEEIRHHLQVMAGAMDTSLPVIDLGCGNGTITRRLTDIFASVLGVDVSPQAVAAAHSAQPQVAGLSFRSLDATQPAAAAALAARTRRRQRLCPRRAPCPQPASAGTPRRLHRSAPGHPGQDLPRRNERPGRRPELPAGTRRHRQADPGTAPPGHCLVAETGPLRCRATLPRVSPGPLDPHRGGSHRPEDGADGGRWTARQHSRVLGGPGPGDLRPPGRHPPAGSRAGPPPSEPEAPAAP